MIMTREHYKNDNRNGEHTRWYDDGRAQDRKYYLDGMPIDTSFTRNKRSGFLRLKKYLQNFTRPVYTFLVSDLAKIACPQ